MPISIDDLKIIVARGGGAILDAKKISSNDLKVLAGRACNSEAVITIKNPQCISVNDLKVIASRAEGRVIFDFFDV